MPGIRYRVWGTGVDHHVEPYYLERNSAGTWVMWREGKGAIRWGDGSKEELEARLWLMDMKQQGRRDWEISKRLVLEEESDTPQEN